MSFDYNHNNERTFRRGSNLDRQYAYDESSHLIGEYTGNGALIVEYVWLGDRPIAAVYPSNRIVYIVTDHQSKPRRGIDATTQQVVWSWDADAFGVLQPATGLANGVEVNLRFPGQYYDVQSGLYYNHNRYYNPELGRYMEADPLGLEAGLNPYAYAASSPTNAVDPTGEDYIILNAPAGAGGHGHMAQLFQPFNGGNWFYGTMGTAERASLLTMSTVGVQGHMSIRSTGTANPITAINWVNSNDTSNSIYTNFLLFHTSNAMNAAITNTAFSTQNSINSGQSKYNLLFNNCTNPVINGLNSTGVSLPTMVSPSPNTNFQELQNAQWTIQSQLFQLSNRPQINLNWGDDSSSNFTQSGQYNFQTPQFNFIW